MHTTETKQVGVFPCRGLVAPCQRAPGSITGCRFDVKRGEGDRPPDASAHRRKQRRMHALEGDAVGVLARDENPEGFHAGGEARQVGTVRLTGLERQLDESPEFAGDQ